MPKVKEPRKNILAAALSVLRKNGLPPLSHTSVSEMGDVSRQLVRYYFNTTDEMMFALCSETGDTFQERLERALEDVPGKAKLDALLDFLCSAQWGENYAAYDAFVSLAAGSPQIRANLRGQFAVIGNVVSRELRAAYPDLDEQWADELSYIVVSQVHGHWRMVGALGFDAAHVGITRKSLRNAIDAYRQGGNGHGKSVPEGVWKI